MSLIHTAAHCVVTCFNGC